MALDRSDERAQQAAAAQADSDATAALAPAAPAAPTSARPPGLRAQLWRSILRHGTVDTVQNRLAAVRGNVWLHLHPPRVRRGATRFSYTMCAGGLSFFLFLVTIVTGVVLMFYYRPEPKVAHDDVLAITQVVAFGELLRSVHRYTSDGMIILVLVHLLRVVLTGAYKPPREFNWVIGVLALILTLAIAFTGYLLPWDQQGYWATVVATNMLSATPVIGADGPAALPGADHDVRAALLGGTAVGPATLSRFYVLHCVVLPLSLAALLALHFFRVRKDGFSGPL